MMQRLLAPAAARPVLRAALSHARVSPRHLAPLHTRATRSAPAAAAAASQSANSVAVAPVFPSLAVVDAAPAASTDAPAAAYHKDVKRTWHLFDAKEQVVGRMAGRIAQLLVGKHKPNYNPTTDDGDCVVVLNAKYLRFTGNKWQQKLYRYHTGYVGGLKEIPAERWRHTHPDRILKHAVAGMIHKNKLKVPRLARLKIYPGLVHPHAAQFPFDMIAAVPHLKAARDAELVELAAQKQVEVDAANLATSGGKKTKTDAAKGSDESGLQGADDGTMPENPEIRKAIIKDREQRKGKPIVML